MEPRSRRTASRVVLRGSRISTRGARAKRSASLMTGSTQVDRASAAFVERTLETLAVTDRIYHDLHHERPLVTQLVARVRALRRSGRVLVVAPKIFSLRGLGGPWYRGGGWGGPRTRPTRTRKGPGPSRARAQSPFSRTSPAVRASISLSFRISLRRPASIRSNCYRG